MSYLFLPQEGKHLMYSPVQETHKADLNPRGLDAEWHEGVTRTGELNALTAMHLDAARGKSESQICSDLQGPVWCYSCNTCGTISVELVAVGTWQRGLSQRSFWGKTCAFDMGCLSHILAAQVRTQAWWTAELSRESTKWCWCDQEWRD